MSTKTDYLLKALQVIAWILFVGLCIEAGGILTNTVIALFFDPDFAGKFWNHSDLSKLQQFHQASFVTLICLMSIVTTLKAVLFYVIVKVFHDKKLDLSKPFNERMGKYIDYIAYCAIGIGIFSKWGADTAEWVLSQKIELPSIQQLKMGGADVWLLMGFVLLVFAKIFKKGIALQVENDLTV